MLRVGNNIHNIFGLESAEMIEEFEEEEKIPVKASPPSPAPAAAKPDTPKSDAPAEGAEAADKPAEEQQSAPPAPAPEAPKQEYEIKKRNKKVSTYLKWSFESHAMPAAMVKTFVELENKHMEEDTKIIDHKHAKNDLEAYCYEMR